jgi:hypothetical protein
MNRPEYMRIPLSQFPPDIIQKYNLLTISTSDGYVYIRINKGMYGLKQAALLAYDQLVRHLVPYGYYPVPHCPGIWRHQTRRARFASASMTLE